MPVNRLVLGKKWSGRSISGPGGQKKGGGRPNFEKNDRKTPLKKSLFSILTGKPPPGTVFSGKSHFFWVLGQKMGGKPRKNPGSFWDIGAWLRAFGGVRDRRR